MLHSLFICPEQVYKGTLFPDVLPLAKNSDCFFRLSEMLPGVFQWYWPTVSQINCNPSPKPFPCSSAWVTMNVSSDSQDGHFFFLTKKCSEDLYSETCSIMQTICHIVSVTSWKIWLESRTISLLNLLPTALFALNMKSRLSEDGYMSAYPWNTTGKNGTI